MHHIFLAAREAWQSAATLRNSRARFKDYTYGRQWGDTVTTPDGDILTEGEVAQLTGRKPLTNNMIRQLIKSIVGRFRHSLTNDKSFSLPSPSGRFDKIAAANSLDELDCRLLEEYLISGCAIQRIITERTIGHTDSPEVRIDNVSPGAFFVNRFSDPRGSDIQLIGMLHDLSLNEVIMRYAHGCPTRAEMLRRIYQAPAPLDFVTTTPELGEPYNRRFSEAIPSKCRVIEVWALECNTFLRCHDPISGRLFATDTSHASMINKLNDHRRSKGRDALAMRNATSLQWHGYFFAPDGTLLDHTLSPYPHGSHPFVLKFYPYIDGEIHPFVEDIIDTQRYINRLITHIDTVLGFSAKGVLLFPEDAKPDDLDWNDIASRWSSNNGIIRYRNAHGQLPQQLFTSPSSIGAAQELLGIEMRLFEQISGVSGALKGESASGHTGADLYNAQIEQSAISLLDIFDSFNSFRRMRNDKIIHTY